MNTDISDLLWHTSHCIQWGKHTLVNVDAVDRQLYKTLNKQLKNLFIRQRNGISRKRLMGYCCLPAWLAGRRGTQVCDCDRLKTKHE